MQSIDDRIIAALEAGPLPVGDLEAAVGKPFSLPPVKTRLRKRGLTLVREGDLLRLEAAGGASKVRWVKPGELLALPALQCRASGIDLVSVAAYAEAMREAGGWGSFPPMIAFEGNGAGILLASGFHRREAALAAGVDPVPVEVRPGGMREALVFSAGENAEHGLPRTNEDKRRSVEVLLDDEEWSAWPDRQIAQAARVSHTFVANLRRQRAERERVDEPAEGARAVGGNVAASEDARCERTVDLFEGSTLGAARAVVDNTRDGGDADNDCDDDDCDDREGDDDCDGFDGDLDPLDISASDRARLRAHGQEIARATLASSESNEWYTPDWILEAGRKALGGEFELDPASCEAANARVRAGRFFGLEDDGLGQPWICERLWLNPPYGGQTSEWVGQLVFRHKGGQVGSALALVNAVPDRSWFDRLWAASAAVCFLSERVRFSGPGGEAGSRPTHPSALFLLTTGRVAPFCAAFKGHGRIVLSVESARAMGELHAEVRIAL